METVVKSYLGESAFVQKRGAKLRLCRGNAARAIPGGVVAKWPALLARWGCFLGLVCGRASERSAKPDGSALFLSHPVATSAVSRQRADRVLQAITSRQRHLLFTDEVPPHPGPQDPVSQRYKAKPKCAGYVRVAGTGSYRPRLQGCQQSQSRMGRLPRVRSERQNHREPWVETGFTRKVSGALAATTWPAGTSFRQSARGLRNVPQQPHLRSRAVPDS